MSPWCVAVWPRATYDVSNGDADLRNVSCERRVRVSGLACGMSSGTHFSTASGSRPAPESC